jgi:hypothetical protein
MKESEITYHQLTKKIEELIDDPLESMVIIMDF